MFAPTALSMRLETHRTLLQKWYCTCSKRCMGVEQSVMERVPAQPCCTHLRAHDALGVAGSDGPLDGPAEDGLVVQWLHPQEAQEAVQILQAVLQQASYPCQSP